MCARQRAIESFERREMQRKQNALKRPQALASRIHAMAQRKHMMQEDHSSNHTCLGQNAHEDMDTGRLSNRKDH